MIRDLLTVLWKERLEYLRLHGSLRSTVVTTIVPLLILGVYMPLQIGRFWVDSFISVILWGWLPLVLTTMVVADSVAGERERHTLETLLSSRISDRALLLGKLIAPMIHSLFFTTIIMAVSILTLNLSRPGGGFLFFRPEFLLAGLLAGILGAAFSSAAGTLVSLRVPTVRQAQQTVSLGILAATFLPIIAVNLLPAKTKTTLFAILDATDPLWAGFWVFALFLAADALLIALAFHLFRRTKLMETP